MITAECEAQINLLEWFGRCIANIDMHFGNLSFFWSKVEDTVSLNLAPIYDMLPMLYAPEKSEIVERMFRLPRAAEVDTALVLAGLSKLLIYFLTGWIHSSIAEFHAMAWGG